MEIEFTQDEIDSGCIRYEIERLDSNSITYSKVDYCYIELFPNYITYTEKAVGTLRHEPHPHQGPGEDASRPKSTKWDLKLARLKSDIKSVDMFYSDAEDFYRIVMETSVGSIITEFHDIIDAVSFKNTLMNWWIDAGLKPTYKNYKRNKS